MFSPTLPLTEDTLPEADTIEEARRGDSAALSAIFRAFSKRVAGLCRRLLRDQALAEDAAAEVFLRLPHSLASYDRASNFEPWLLRVTANHCIDILRRQKRERLWLSGDEIPAAPPSSDASPLTLLLVQERHETVARAVEDLEEAYRLPLLLRYHAGLSYENIAAQLGLEKTQVAGRIFRAKHLLRKSLETL